jgi:hypothetical protein
MNTTHSRRIFLYVPDGVGVRNYLYADLISILNSSATVGMYHSLPSLVINEVEKVHGKVVELHQIPPFVEQRNERVLRDVATFARLMRNSAVRKNERIWKSLLLLKNRKGFWKIYYALVCQLAKLAAANVVWIDKIDKLLNKQYAHNPVAPALEALLKQTKPDVILCTHQRVPEASTFAEVCKKLNIPFVTAIFSWDNLPKSRIAPRAHKYIVWSTYMKKEMEWYYPTISQNDVIITGTPQFECYAKSSMHQPKADFLAQWNLPHDKKLVLLSGNDMTSPNDHYYFDDLAEAIMQMPEAEQPHLILRRAPVDASGRFDAFAKKYAGILTTIDPLWTNPKSEKDGFGSLPTFADISLLTNLCLHCDLVVNIGSTMGLDFAHFNKPAVYINYPKPYNADWYNIDFIYGLEHFRTLDGLDAVLWIKSKADIVPVIQAGLNTPGNVAVHRNEWKHKLTDDIPNASENIARLLLQLAEASEHNQ